MAFIRTVKRENPFVQLDKTFFEDENLQWESKGLLGYILSRPDDWKVNQTDLAKRSSGGKTKVESALLDLMANGYVNWYPIRKEDGTIDEWVYDVYERPEFNPKKDECIIEGRKRIEAKKARNKRKNEKKKDKRPESDNPEVDNPDLGKLNLDNPAYNNNDLKDIDLNNIEEEEEIKLDDVISFMNDQITKRKITNEKTIKAIHEVSANCKAIGTNNIDSMRNYCIKVVEEKMSKLGQKQKAKNNKSIRTEPPLPDWCGEPEDEFNKLLRARQEQDEKNKIPREQYQAEYLAKKAEKDEMLKQIRRKNK